MTLVIIAGGIDLSVGSLISFVGAVIGWVWLTTNNMFLAILAGLLTGVGILMLIRHRASLGGLTVLAIYLQDKHGWRAGKVQMAVDCCIVLLALWSVEPLRVAWSIAGAVALNLVLAMNHRPGRYMAV